VSKDACRGGNSGWPLSGDPQGHAPAESCESGALELPRCVSIRAFSVSTVDQGHVPTTVLVIPCRRCGSWLSGNRDVLPLSDGTRHAQIDRISTITDCTSYSAPAQSDVRSGAVTPDSCVRHHEALVFNARLRKFSRAGLRPLSRADGSTKPRVFSPIATGSTQCDLENGQPWLVPTRRRGEITAVMRWFDLAMRLGRPGLPRAGRALSLSSIMSGPVCLCASSRIW